MPYGTERTDDGTYLLTRTGEDATREAVRLSELCSPSFMQAHTVYSSFDALLGDSDVEVRTKQDFLEMDDEAQDRLIDEQTPFADWAEMQERAWKMRDA